MRTKMTKSKVVKEISDFKERLIRKAKRAGLYENFGQKEVGILEDRYREYQYTQDGVWAEIMAFYNWCINYDMR